MSLNNEQHETFFEALKTKKLLSQPQFSYIRLSTCRKTFLTSLLLLFFLTGNIVLVSSHYTSQNKKSVSDDNRDMSINWHSYNKVMMDMEESEDNAQELFMSTNNKDGRLSQSTSGSIDLPESIGYMNIYICKSNQGGIRRQSKRYRFPVARYNRQRFPLNGPFISFAPELPVFIDRSTRQTIIYSSTEDIYIIPPLISFYGEKYSIGELIKFSYASLVRSGVPPTDSINMLSYFHPSPLSGPDIPTISSSTGGFISGIRTYYSSFIIPKYPIKLVNIQFTHESKEEDYYIASSSSQNSHNKQHPRSSKVDTKSVRIGIVGSGISGLNAALTLLDSNLFSPENIFIYEANHDIGGRIHSKFWSTENQTSEWCGEFLDSDDYVMLNLAKRFNIDIIDTLAAANPAYHSTYYFLKRYYTEDQAWIDYQSIANIIIDQLNLIGVINYKESNAYGRYFDNLSLYDWIEKYVPNGHKSDLGEYIDSAYLQEYGIDTQILNSLSFLFEIDPRSQPTNGPLSIYGLSDQRYRMFGGNEYLPRKIAKYLTDRGVTIELNHNLTKIVKLNNNKYRLTFSNNHKHTFDHIILTNPLPTYRYIDYKQAQFDTLKKKVIREMLYGTTTKLNVQFSKRFWNDLSADGIIYTNLPFLNSWEDTVGQPGETGVLVLFTGGTYGTLFTPRRAFDTITNSTGNISEVIYLDDFLAELDEIWPGGSKYYTGEATVSAPWVSKYSYGSYPSYTLGQYSTIHGYESVRQGNAHFAGDFASIENFGMMEGAASTGKRAANEIINDYITEISMAD